MHTLPHFVLMFAPTLLFLVDVTESSYGKSCGSHCQSVQFAKELSIVAKHPIMFLECCF
jgi:hypothetical protein